MHRWLLSGALICATGCLPSPGPCDQNAALELVYTEDGTPAFAGQAIVQASCGNGGFCHSSGEITGSDRFGAPVDLGFDVRIASTSDEVQAQESERLREHLSRVLGMRRDILAQIQASQMPPRGDAGEDYRCQIEPSSCGGAGQDLTFDRFEDDGVTFSPLPTLLDTDAARRDEAQEIVRNWLSCRTPVVERTNDRMDRGENLVGFTIPACERTCVDLRWPDIYTRLVEPSCATSRCHDDDDPAAGLDLLSGGAAGVHARVVAGGQGADGAQCSSTGLLIVAPMSPDDSLLLNKVEAASSDDVCGSRMPLSGNPLSPQRLCVLRSWIECGACAEADGGACAACLDAARAACNVDPGSATGCATTAPCTNRATL
ncbi:MAG: hypothetical protein R3B82_16775 [Sandaracinaceae bacterium]